MPELMITAPAQLTTDRADQAAARRSLRAQIAKLEYELSTFAADAHPRAGFELRVAADGRRRVLDIGQLEQLRDALVAKLEQARATLRDCRAVERENAVVVDRMIADPASYRWVQVSAEDVGARSCKHWHSLPRFGIIGMMLGWWRVKISSGCPLAGG